MRRFLSRALKRVLRLAGRELVVTDPLWNMLARRRLLMLRERISLVLDVGANDGQFACELRADGYKGRIVSFEPLALHFGRLCKVAEGSPPWQPMQIALGAAEGKATINVAGNAGSHSILPMLPRHIQASPDAAYVGAEEIVVRKLDALFPSLCRQGDAVLLKIDTQGYEMSVLAGGEEALPRIALIQLELSFVELYEKAPLYDEVMKHLTSRGYRLAALFPGTSDRSSWELLQCDGLFLRSQRTSGINDALRTSTRAGGSQKATASLNIPVSSQHSHQSMRMRILSRLIRNAKGA
jgi:FkbM family methyltransferase